jgi:hypothetical protein
MRRGACPGRLGQDGPPGQPGFFSVGTDGTEGRRRRGREAFFFDAKDAESVRVMNLWAEELILLQQKKKTPHMTMDTAAPP